MYCKDASNSLYLQSKVFCVYDVNLFAEDIVLFFIRKASIHDTFPVLNLNSQLQIV